MKPFLIRLSLFASIQFVILGFVLTRGAMQSRNHFYCALYDKVERMDQTQQPRLLLVGGSNVAFGIDSRDFEELQHVPVNLGLHAGVGMDFYLKIVEERVRERDIVLLMPEYEWLTASPNPALQEDLAAHCPEFASYFELPKSQGPSWKHWLDHEALDTLHTQVRQAFHKRNKEEIYRRSAFNEYGDLVAHRDRSRPQNDLPGPAIALDPAVVRSRIQRLNAFARYCRERGAEVYFSHPPLPQARYTASHAALGRLQQLLDGELHVVQIDRPADSVYESKDFFDTYYHLAGPAIHQRSERLAQSLQLLRVANSEPRSPSFQ